MFKIKSKIFWLFIVLINSFLIILLALFIFGLLPDYSINQTEKSKLIGASYMTMNNEFFQIIHEEIADKVEMEGDQIVLRDPSLNSDRQIEQIKEMIDQGVDALIINPVDWDKLNNVLKEAKEKGIFVLVVDSDISDPDLIDTTVKSNNYHAGEVVGQYFLAHNPEANLVLMTHQNAKSGQDRIGGFINTIKSNPNIRVVDSLECQGQTEYAMPQMDEFIKKNIPFDTVFCLNDLASLGVVASLEENHLLDKVKVYGVDASPDSKALIYEGMMQATAAQFPTKIGLETASALYRLFDGDEVESMIEIPVELITKDNVNSFGIDRWQ